MNSQQIDSILRYNQYSKRYFKGVYAADQLPLIVDSYPAAFVVNTDPSHKPGTHWVSFYFNANGNGDFFDSYGKTPEFYNDEFKVFLDNNTGKWKYNKKQLQHISSVVCGQYVVYYLIMKCRPNVDGSKIMSVFTKDKTFNDWFVKTFVNTYFCHQLCFVGGQTCTPFVCI